jgi:hypothetical protein
MQSSVLSKNWERKNSRVQKLQLAEVKYTRRLTKLEFERNQEWLGVTENRQTYSSSTVRWKSLLYSFNMKISFHLSYLPHSTIITSLNSLISVYFSSSTGWQCFTYVCTASPRLFVIYNSYKISVSTAQKSTSTPQRYFKFPSRIHPKKVFLNYYCDSSECCGCLLLRLSKSCCFSRRNVIKTQCSNWRLNS